MSEWKKAGEATEFPPCGQYVFCYVLAASSLPFLEPAVGISYGDKVVDRFAGRKVVMWLDAPSPPEFCPAELAD